MNTEIILIEYNDDEEMMKITKGGKLIFYGNYTDFPREPDTIRYLFIKLGLIVDQISNLPPIG